jgi:hypothetical protein
MMLSPLEFQALADHVIRERLDEAAREALAQRVPRTHHPRRTTAIRHRAATSLRALAFRLDPTIGTELRPALAP